MPASLPALIRDSWQPHLALGITGHRASNPSYRAHADDIAAALAALFARIDAIAADLPGARGAVRLHSLMVDGTDQVAAELALAQGWELAVPLPFGSWLNAAINAHAATLEDIDALLAGQPAADPAVEARAAAIRGITARAQLFELADRDAEIEAMWRASLAAPESHAAARAFEALVSDKVALAGRVMIERVDLVVAVWDGKVANLPGGTGHTITAALTMGTPVLLIDPTTPEAWRILTRPEELAQPCEDCPPDHARLAAIIAAAVAVPGWDPALLAQESWRPRSSPFFGLYRRIERVFGGGGGSWLGSMRVSYEAPETIAQGSGAGVVAAARSLPGGDAAVAGALAEDVLPMFAWADGIANRLADAYRSGMTVNFVLAALAVIIGIAFLPTGLGEVKWAFALVELLLLGGILAMTAAGSRYGWHRRWFAMRRVAEYLRHAPALLLMGVARSTGRWPQAGGDAREEAGAWPEHFARHALRDVGLPRIAMTRDYLRAGMAGTVLPHVTAQRAYHTAKAHRLETVHHRLDKAAETCFALAVASVTAYLALKGAGIAGIVPKAWAGELSPLFTFLGVAFPTLGANLSGIRYFGDFERFAAISHVAAEKLGGIEARIELLLSGAPEALTYAAAADLIHALDEAVVEEIASWQAVFGAKHLALPA
jgi:hypothetical protein